MRYKGFTIVEVLVGSSIMLITVKTEESKLFVNTRIAIIDKILEERGAK